MFINDFVFVFNLELLTLKRQHKKKRGIPGLLYFYILPIPLINNKYMKVIKCIFKVGDTTMCIHALRLCTDQGI